MFFYSNYLGLVMTTCATFDSVSEITAATGRDCDFLYLHIVPERNSDIRERISFKTFLEPLKLLENRMNYLINISAADEPPCIETIFKTLTAMEGESPAKKPSTIDAWDNVANTSEKSEAAQPREPSSQEVKPLRMGTYIDQSVGLDSKAKQSKDTPFFRLPAHPVQYVPQGDLFLASESMFDVSTKALFHVIFGDRSNIWYVLQHRLGGKNIHQGPWLSQGSNRMRRDFTYNVEYTNALGKITKLDVFDYQLIDVMNDHLCYVITDKKTPWNLPLKRSFRLVTKA
ncbi:SNF1-interacting protein, partial [Ascosphaera atra]